MSSFINKHAHADAIASLHPAPEHGIHTWIFGSACHLAGHGFTAQEIAAALAPRCIGLRRPVPAGEIEEAAASAMREVAGRADTAHVAPTAAHVSRWPSFDEQLARNAIERAYHIAPPRWTKPPTVAVAVAALFRPGELVCIGDTLETADTRPLEAWLADPAIERAQFVVPSPMSKPLGITKEGKESPRCLDNTGPRRWLVVEFDNHWSHSQQFALHFHLGGIAPLAAIVHSAGKSCHGWFNVENEGANEVRAFFNYAVRLGADPATFTPCQFVRLPGGWRPDKEKQQEIVFWNVGVSK